MQVPLVAPGVLPVAAGGLSDTRADPPDTAGDRADIRLVASVTPSVEDHRG